MSHSVGLEIVVVGMGALLEAVVQCGLDHVQARQFQTDDGQTHAVDLVVSDNEGAKVGVKVDKKTGEASFIAHDCKGGKGKALAHRIAQRWAYSKLTEELRRKGYQIAKEEKQRDGTIKLTASKWK
jgi:hypothetical protein